MGLETGTYFQDLNQSNPIGATDPKAQGDDHIRLLKTTAKNTFPNATKPFYFPVVLQKTANYTVLSSDDNALVECNASGGAFTLTLPTLPASPVGFRVYVAKTDASANALTVQGLGGELIDGLSSLKMRKARQFIAFYWNGTGWTTTRGAGIAEAISKTVDATLTEDEIDFIVATATLANTTLTLPAVANLRGRFMVVKKLTSPNQVILDANAAETIDGATTYTLSKANETVVLFCTGAAWLVVSSRLADPTVAFTLSVPFIKNTTALTDAATVAWDLSIGGPNYSITITNNRTLGAFTGGTAGQEGYLTVKEDGTGGWALDMTNGAYLWPGPSALQTHSRAANDETLYRYRVLAGGTTMQLERLNGTVIANAGRDLLAVQAASGATVDFVLTKWLQLYDRFEIDFYGVQGATDNEELWLRTSTDGGATYQTSGYSYSQQRWAGNGSDVPTSGVASALLLISNLNTNGMSNAANELADGDVVLFIPTSAGRCKIRWDIMHYPATGTNDFVHTVGAGIKNSAADVDAIRFLCGSGGNFANGTFRLYGVKK